MKHMATRRIFIAFLLLAVAFVSSSAAAQTQRAPQLVVPGGQLEMHELVLKDGSRLFGRIVSETDQQVVFRTQSGSVITVARQEVVSLTLVRGRLQRGEFVRADMHRSRLFFAPTGRSLEKGQVSVGVFQVIAPFIQVGVTDDFSIGGGTPLIFGIEDFDRPFWITPKYRVIKTEKVQAAVGVLHVFDTTQGDSAGIGYGVATYGSSDNAITAGAGVAYSGDSRGGMVMIGGERRVSRNIKVITENYIWQDGGGIISGGFRFIGERLSADLGVARPIGDGWFAPVVNFVYVF